MAGMPEPADEEVAAAVFASHVARVSASTQARARGWRFTWLDPLHVVVSVHATRATGEQDIYYVKLGAEFYDLYPPTTSFVCPPPQRAATAVDQHQWPAARQGSRWFPLVDSLPWFAIHDAYPFQVPSNSDNASTRQLVCCSMTLEYYLSNHQPTPGQRWQQGRHTLGATLNRIHDALNTVNYKGPSGADDS